MSIIVPVHNDGSSIRETIESVLRQKYTHVELIVVDDGSVDDTASLVDAAARRDARIFLVRQEHQGTASARNAGFRRARGEYFTWIGRDVRFKPDALQRLISCLKGHPHWDMVSVRDDSCGSASIQPQDAGGVHVEAKGDVGAACLYRSRVPYCIGEYDPVVSGLDGYDYWMRVHELLTLQSLGGQRADAECQYFSDMMTDRWAQMCMDERRRRLMVFDDFRRDTALAPMIWCIESQGDHDDGRRICEALMRSAVRRGDCVVHGSELKESRWPRSGTPMAYVCVGPNPSWAVPPIDLPESALRAYVHAGASPLPDEMEASWDVCCAVAAKRVRPVMLSRPWQGWLVTKRSADVFDVIDMRARSRCCERWHRRAHQPDPPSVDASVVIHAFRRPESLRAAIASVLEQKTACAFEMLVVNNDPQDMRIGSIIEQFRTTKNSACRDIRMVPCHQRGIAAARNVSLSEARGRALLCIDDDVVVREGWMQGLWTAFCDHPDAGVIGGEIVVRTPDPRPAWLTDALVRCWGRFEVAGEGYAAAERWEQYPFSGNWIASRAALLAVGGFRRGYGRSGGDYGSGEEIVAASLVRACGWGVGVVPGCSVEHRVEPGRMTAANTARAIISTIVSNNRMRYDLYRPMDITVAGLLRQGRELVRHSMGRALDARTRVLHVQIGMAFLRAGCAHALHAAKRWWGMA